MSPSTCEISDSDWEVIKKLIPEEKFKGAGSAGGRPNADLRRILEGILFWVRTGCQWRLIPVYYGSKTTLAKYLKKWASFDLFTRLMELSLELYDQEVGIQWKFQSIDGSIKRAPGCSEGTGPNPTDRARPGTKQMIVCDQKGIPLATTMIPANNHDMHQIEATFVNFQVQRPSPKVVEQHLCADKGFDSKENRETLGEWGYRHHVRKKGEGWSPIRKFNAKRWVVERTHSWINQYRGIHTRRIKRDQVFEELSRLAISCIIFSKLI